MDLLRPHFHDVLKIIRKKVTKKTHRMHVLNEELSDIPSEAVMILSSKIKEEIECI